MKVGASTWPSMPGMLGKSGYSAFGISCMVNVDLPEVMVNVVELAER